MIINFSEKLEMFIDYYDGLHMFGVVTLFVILTKGQ